MSAVEIPEGSFREVFANDPDLIYRFADRKCGYWGRDVNLRTNGMVDLRTAADSLKTPAYKLIERNRESERPAREVAAYLSATIQGESVVLKNEYLEHAQDQAIFAELGERRYFVVEEIPSYEDEMVLREEEAARADMASGLAIIVREAAGVLNIKVNEEDLVDTALAVVRQRRRLKGDMREQVDDIAKRLAANGYRVSGQGRRGNGEGLQLVYSLIENDPNITTESIRKIAQRRGVFFTEEFLVAAASRKRRALNVRTPKRVALIDRVREILNSGIKDFRLVCDRLSELGVVFKPSRVRQYIRKINREAV